MSRSIYLAENFLYSLFENLWISGAFTLFHALSYKELQRHPLPRFIVGNNLRVRVNHFLRDLWERIVVDNLRQAIEQPGSGGTSLLPS